MIINSKLADRGSLVATITRDEAIELFARDKLPLHLKEDFPTLQEFISHYFDFLKHQKTGYTKLSDITDIDSAGREYLTAMYSTFGANMPEFKYMGMADFIRNSRSFFLSKGSEDSFKFLFRIMFGTEIDVRYPKENMLSPSSGKWDSKTSFFVDFYQGTYVDTLVGKKAYINDSRGYTTVVKIVSVGTRDDGSTEVFFNGDGGDQVLIGSTITIYDTLTLEPTHKGVILPSLSSYTIISPGEDFGYGNLYDTTLPTGKCTFRVTALTENRGIKRIEFFDFPDPSNSPETILINGASILLSPKAVNRYTGFYLDTKGFLSNTNVLQDSYFYQIFSYVLKSSVPAELYLDVVSKILHPAGLVMFSEYINQSEYLNVVSNTVDVASSNRVFDFVQLYDTLSTSKSMTRTLSDSITMTEIMLRQWGTTSGLSDQALATDTLRKTVGKGFTDTVLPTDSNMFGFNKVASDSISITSTIRNTFTKTISESVSFTDSFSHT